MVDLVQSGSRILNAWSITLNLSLIKTFSLTKTENKSERSVNATLILLPWKKELFLPKNADFLQNNPLKARLGLKCEI